MARDEKIVIRLTGETKDQFQQLAEEMGMTISSLGSYVIGSFLRQQTQVVAPMIQAMQAQMAQAAQRLITDESMDQEIERLRKIDGDSA